MINEKVIRSLIRDSLKEGMKSNDCPKCMKMIIDITVDEMINVVKENHLTKKDIKKINGSKEIFLKSFDNADHSQ